MHILQTICDLAGIVVILNGWRVRLPGIQIYGSHTGKQGHVEDVAADTDVVIRVKRLHMEAGRTLANTAYHEPWRKPDPTVLVVDYAAAFLVDLARPFAVDPNPCNFENIQRISKELLQDAAVIEA